MVLFKSFITVILIIWCIYINVYTVMRYADYIITQQLHPYIYIL